MNGCDRKRRWGLVLAGGDGIRLRPLTRFICGDERPKQFCPLYGGATLLQQVRKRAERSIKPGQILFSLNRAHEDFYLPLLLDCPSQRIVQPSNRGTAPAILSGLLWIARKDPSAMAAVFPSDHHYSNEALITDAVERAFDLAHRRPNSVVLLGAIPNRLETDYGWIEVGAPVGGRSDSFRVRSFYEKPSQHVARLVWEQEYLWNTFVMVGKALTFLEMICSAIPGLINTFLPLGAGAAPGEELRISDALYEQISYADFSQAVLSQDTSRLIVHRLGDAGWSDLGNCDRAVAALTACDVAPGWVTNWRSLGAAPALTPVSAVA